MNKNIIPSLTIVVPCYNESEVFSFCLTELTIILNDLISKNKISSDSCLLFVDDGSKDDTWKQIELSAESSTLVKGIKLSRNKGHQIALMAGLSVVNTDICISIDADLQDDTNCIYQMVDKYLEGVDIVYGVRNDRSTDTSFKRGTAGLFYKLMSKLGVEQVENHADYRLLSKRALNALLQYKEQNVYIRGMVPLIGFKSEQVFYSRSERIAGESKYPLKKMLALALEGITSLTITPLRLISIVGFLTCGITALAGFYVLIDKLLGNTVEGWTSLMIAIFFLGGVQMLSLGVIGEYVGKIYIESKNRPKFFIEKLLK
ncbi:glycosyltransferase family 2 protein [Actinobacillus pleuropneumoniae]|uniref:glycosyltransferase family 2 protein n=4 Tax=Actinobacillus TaxID=713 RepID=UPI0002FDFBF4|nr:glycosyltransferase family 2 protein [Actinobacillus pleuropneumoniae]